MILASVIVLVAAAVALAVGAAMGEGGIVLVWASAGGAVLSLVLLAVGIRRFRPGPG